MVIFASDIVFNNRIVLEETDDNLIFRVGEFTNENTEVIETNIALSMIEHAFTTLLECCGSNDFMENGKGYNIYKHSMQLSVIDGLDTIILYHYLKNNIVSKNMFRRTLKAILNNNIIHDQFISLFEMNIRITGGLIGGVTLIEYFNITMDKMLTSQLIQKAGEFVDLEMNYYSNNKDIPYAYANLKTNERHYQKWSSNKALLSEIGSHQLEFKALDQFVNKMGLKYRNYPFSTRSDDVFNAILMKSDTLYHCFIDTDSGEFDLSSDISLGAYSDSFYEYILKMFILTKQEIYKNKFIQVATHIESELIQEYFIGNETVYLLKSTKSNAFDHLTCFAGGMFGLASTVIPEHAQHYLLLAHRLTKGCFAVYSSFSTGLGPDTCTPLMTSENEFKCTTVDGYYKLRPELVESNYYLYKITKNRVYRDMNEKIAFSIEKYCKTDFGYVEVQVEDQTLGKQQDSWFLAETLKYLLLTFEENDLLPLNEFVFNTEAHPFKIY